MDLNCALYICKLINKQFNGFDNFNILNKTNVEDYLKDENCEWEYNFKNNTKDIYINFTNISFFKCSIFINKNRIDISHKYSFGEHTFVIKSKPVLSEYNHSHGLCFKVINNNNYIKCLFNWKDVELI